MRVAQCSDRIEPLLVSHDEKYVWLAQFTDLLKAKILAVMPA